MLKKILVPPILLCIVLFLAFPVCVSYQLQDSFLTPRVILTSSALLVLMIILLVRSNSAPAFSNGFPMYAIGAYLLLSAVSILKSLNPGDAWYEWMKSFLIVPVILLVSILFRKEENKISLLKFSQASVLILSSVYVYQWINYLLHPSLDIVFDYRIHIASTLGNKNFYAEVIDLLLAFSVIGFFKLDKLWKGLCAFNSVLLVISLVTTQSFAAIASFLVAVVIVSAIYFSSQREYKISGLKIAGIACVILLLAVVVFKMGVIKSFNQRVETVLQYVEHPQMMDTTTRENSNSTFERLLLWRNSLELVKENPLAGCGAANWKLVYAKYGVGGTRYIEAGNVHYEHPHNDYLLIAAESGLPGLIAFLLFLISIIWVALRKMKTIAMDRVWFSGILFAFICFFIVSFFSFPRPRFYAWMLLGIFSGLLFSFDDDNKVEKKIPGGLWKLILLLCIGITSWSLTAAVARYSGEIHSTLLQIAKKQRNFPRVIRESEKAASWYFPIDETATPFTWYQGMALFYSGAISQAKASYEDALEKNPYHIQLLNDYATACEQTNEREKAIELYKRALAVTPIFPHTLLNISACYFNMGQKDSAFIFIDKLFGIRLNYLEKKSYDVYLPAILREKIYSDADRIPSDVRPTAISHATDTSWVSSTYRNSRRKLIPFNDAIVEALRNNQ